MRMIYRSARGEELPLTDNPMFDLIDVDGQTLGNTNISSTVIGGIDGDTANSVQALPRPLVLTMPIRAGVNVEDAKRAILSVVKLKQQGTLIWSQNDRTLRITGIVEAVNMPRWNNTVAMQITMHCETPYWEDYDNQTVEISGTSPLHCFTYDPADMLYFPEEGIPLSEYDMIRTKSFVNTGDISVGAEIEILAYSTVNNPILRDGNGKFFGIGYPARSVQMNQYDVIRICTVKGAKSAVLISGNRERSLLGDLKPGSTWLQIETGENLLTIDSDDFGVTDNMSFTVSFRRRFI